jgi:hypothetical protein
LNPGLKILQIIMQDLVLPLPETVIVTPCVIKQDEDVPRSLEIMGDALDLLDEPDAIAVIAPGLVILQRLQFGLHHGAALPPNYGIDGSGITLQEVHLFHVRLH